MEIKTKNRLVLWALLLITTNSLAQFSGPNPSTVGSTATYTFDNGTLYNRRNWLITNGTINSTSFSGTSNSANVTWGSTCGTGTLTFRNLNTVIGTLDVALNPADVPTPTASFSVNICRISTVTRTGSPPACTTWYWQTSTSGTSTANSSTVYTMSTAGWLYLRAYAGGTWSSAQSAGHIAGPIDPVPPSAANNSRCGTGTVTLNATPGWQGDNIRWYTASSGGSLLSTSTSYITPTLTPGTYYYYAATLNTAESCESTSRTTVTVTVYTIPDVTTSGTLEICSGSATAISISNPNGVGGTTFAWTAVWVNTSGAASGSGSTIAQTLSTVSGTEGTATYTITPTANGCAGTPINRVVTVTTIPTISTSGPNPLVMGTSTQLSTTLSYSSYQWKKDTYDLSTGTPLTLIGAGSYTVSAKSSATSAQCLSSAVSVGTAFAQQGVNVDVVSTTTIFKEGVSPSSSLYALQPEEYAQVNQYADGLGRVFQTVGQGLSPVNRGDVVNHIAYGRDGLQETSYLPFVTSAADGRVRKNAVRNTSGVYAGSDQQQFYQGTSKVAADNYPYSQTKFRREPNARVIEQGAPGLDWQPGGGHTVRNTMTVNTTSYPVRYWKSNGTTTQNYPAKTVLVSITTDENGNQVRNFTNKMGQTVLKQVQLEEVINSVMVNWLDTYYIYDDFGNLTYQVPPKAVAILDADPNLETDTNLGELIFKYTYDTRGRLVEKKEPGAAVKYLVYDIFDRMVLSQDGTLRNQGKWAFVKYDVLGRTVMSGLYTNSKGRVSVQKWVDKAYTASSTPYPESNYIEEKSSAGGSAHGYTSRSFPKDTIQHLAVSYYDAYDFDGNGVPSYTYDNAHISGLPALASATTRGLATGSKRVLLDVAGNVTTNWLKGAIFYDGYDRVIQTQGNNHLDLNAVDKNSVLYNNIRRVAKTKSTHTAQAVTTHITQRNDFDHAGRVLKTYHQINSGTEYLVAQYEYNALGQIVDKKLHFDTGIAAFLQSVDFRYSIRGWLKSINNADLSNDSGATNDETTDYFGMELAYNTAAGMGNSYYYNGNIAAAKWKTLGEAVGAAGQRSYTYGYDKSDRLETATFQANTGSGWTREVNTLNETMTYDHNGNIATLVRNKNTRGLSGSSVTSSATAIDNLAYTYTANTNSLSKVEDAGTTEGFVNGVVNGTNEYTYTNDGSLNKDDNKGISSITYNILGKPQVINFTSGKKVEYVYDAAGTKLTVKTWQGTTLEKCTNYSGGFVYEGSTPAMSFFSSPEGRVVKSGSTHEYQYSLADHQGNTRVLFTSAAPSPLQYLGTYELPQDYGFSVDTTKYVTFNSANHTQNGKKVFRMNQSNPMGPGKSIKVYPGDKVDMEVYGYFENGSGYGSTNAAVATMVTAIAVAFGGVSGAGGESGLKFDGVNSALGGSGIFGLGPNPGDSRPAAFINYILFDAKYKVVDMGWTVVPASASFATQKMEIPQVTVKEAGYIFVYLSYEDQSNNYVYFDDFKVTYTPSRLIQGNEYYPYGLQTANSWTRESTLGNNFLYNGGTESNTTTQVYDLFFRNYDPTLGRFGQVDPMAGKYGAVSPYHFAGNNPVVFNDPKGDDYDTSDPNRVYRGSDPYGAQGIPIYSGRDIYKASGGEGKPMSLGEFLSSAWDSENGGHWENGSGFLFERQSQTLAYGMEYNDRHSAWQHTAYGSRIGTEFAFVWAKATGQVPLKATVDSWLGYKPKIFRPHYTASIASVGSDSNNEPGFQDWTKLILRISDPYGLPDAIGWSLNFDLTYFGGFVMTLDGGLVILGGPDAGSQHKYLDAGLAVGLDIGLSLNLTKYYYTGDIANLRAEDFNGFRTSITIGASYFAELGIGVAIAPVLRGGYIIGITGHIGVSPPGFSGNVSAGHSGIPKN